MLKDKRSEHHLPRAPVRNAHIITVYQIAQMAGRSVDGNIISLPRLSLWIEMPSEETFLIALRLRLNNQITAKTWVLEFVKLEPYINYHFYHPLTRSQLQPPSNPIVSCLTLSTAATTMVHEIQTLPLVFGWSTVCRAARRELSAC